jgi:chitin deacetylase
MIPYTLEANDMRFAVSPGWVTGRDFGDYLCDSFDVLHAEGGRMMSVGLHCRLVGRPAKAAGLQQFLRHARQKGGAWFATRGQIAAHWAAHHPPQARDRPSEMHRKAFVQAFGGIVEHSPWVADRAWSLDLGPAHDSATGLANALARVLRAASEEGAAGRLRAHPDPRPESSPRPAPTASRRPSRLRRAQRAHRRGKGALRAMTELTSTARFPFIARCATTTRRASSRLR